MRKIKIIFMAIFMFSFSPTVSFASTDKILDENVVLNVKQNLYLEIPKEGGTPEEIEELKEIYESAGWIVEGDYFIKEAKQENVTVEYGDDVYQTSSKGSVVIPVTDKQDEEIEIRINSVGNEMDTYLVEVDRASITEVVQDIYLDEIIAEMGKEEHEHSNTADNSSDNTGRVLGGKTYPRGSIVHCNRFNGYLGDGKYYDKFEHPILAAKNFVQSDCAVALIFYDHCLSDYAKIISKRYCSLNTSNNKGRCSVLSKVGHSRKYHRHTGFFSPSN
ncbi:hypothetical protein V5E38_14165 [Rossellomorea sp. GAMAL-10_SWC]